MVRELISIIILIEKLDEINREYVIDKFYKTITGSQVMLLLKKLSQFFKKYKGGSTNTQNGF